MQSLLEIASAAVAYNANIYSTDCISGLPRPALEGVLPYLSASDLHKISDNVNTSGIHLNTLWKRHVTTRWKRTQPVIDVFHDQEKYKDYHKIYLIKHFLDLLNFCAVDESSADPSNIYMSPLHKLKKPLTFSTISVAACKTINRVDELLKFSKYGEIIKGSVTVHCRYIYNNKELLETLLKVTKIIQIHHISNYNYNLVRKFLQTFISKGNVSRAIFSTVKLSEEYFVDFMQVCAGIESEIDALECEHCVCENVNITNSVNISGVYADVKTSTSTGYMKTVDIDGNSITMNADTGTCSEDNVTMDTDTGTCKMKTVEDTDRNVNMDADRHTPVDGAENNVIMDTGTNTCNMKSGNSAENNVTMDTGASTHNMKSGNSAENNVTMDTGASTHNMKSGNSAENNVTMDTGASTHNMKSGNSAENNVTMDTGTDTYKIKPVVDSNLNMDTGTGMDYDHDTTPAGAWTQGLFDKIETDRMQLDGDSHDEVGNDSDWDDDVSISVDDECKNDGTDIHFPEIDLFNEAVKPLPKRLSKKESLSAQTLPGTNEIGCSSCSTDSMASGMKQHRKLCDPVVLTERLIDYKRIKIRHRCSSCEKSRSNINANSYLHPIKGLTSFVILNSSVLNPSTRKDMSKALVQVLPHWTSLKEIGFFDTDASSEESTCVLLNKLENHQLTHLVLDDVRLHQNFFARILEIFQKHYRSNIMEEKPLELLDLQANANTLTVPESLHITVPQNGVKSLDLSMNGLTDTAVTALLDFIRLDTALVHLKLNGCFMGEEQVIGILQALRERNQIEVLGLSGNRIMNEIAEAELLKFIISVTSLKHISLNYCRLRSQFVKEADFVKAIESHPNLKELSIKSNHLESAAVHLMKEICCSDISSLSSLNIGYNWIKGQELLDAASEIKAKRHLIHCTKQTALDQLCISGNRLSHNVQEQLRLSYRGIVKELEADSIDFVHPHAEHEAQM